MVGKRGFNCLFCVEIEENLIYLYKCCKGQTFRLLDANR